MMKTATPTQGVAVARDRRWRNATITPLFFLIGTLLWLIGSATFAGSQPRLRVNIIPPATVASAAVRTGGLYTASWVLWIIASCFWIVGAFLHLITAHVQAALVTVSGVRPGIARWVLLSAWLQLIATIIVLIGSAVFSSGTLDGVSAGAILLLTGFTMWGHAILIAFGIAYVISTVSVIMPQMVQRQYAWAGIVSLLFLLVQFILLNLGSVLLVVRDPPGVWLTAALLYIIASIYGLVGWYINAHSHRTLYAGAGGTLLPFVLTAMMTSTALAAGTGGAATGAALGAGMGAGMAASKGVPGTTMGTSAYPGSSMSTVPVMPATTAGTTGSLAGTTPGMMGTGTTPTNVGALGTTGMMGTGTTPTNVGMTGMGTTGYSTTPTTGLGTGTTMGTTPLAASQTGLSTAPQVAV